LGREPDAAGMASWTNAMNGNGNNRANVVRGFLDSPEYRSHFVTTLYQEFLGRAPDAGGLQYFMGLLASNRNEVQILAAIVGSDEYYLRAGGTSDGFVNAIYRDLLGRSPDASGLPYWVNLTNQANGGGSNSGGASDQMSRDEVARAMLFTTEGSHKLIDVNYLSLRGPVVPAPAGTPQTGPYALAETTGDGYAILFFQGNGNVPALDTYYNQLQQSNASRSGANQNDEDAIINLLSSDDYFGSGGNGTNGGGTNGGGTTT
jgi:hypothetical protein